MSRVLAVPRTGPLPVGDQHVRGVQAQGVVQGAQGGGRVQRVTEALGELRDVVRVGGHAALAPQRPADGEAAAVPPPGRHELPPVGQVGVHETVGGGVAGLPGVAEHAAAGGERHEEVQSQVGAGRVQVHQPRDLGRQHPLQIAVGAAHDVPVPQQPGRVDDAVEPAVPPYHVLDRVRHRGGVGDVGAQVLRRAEPPQVDVVRRGAPAQHEPGAGGVPRDVGGEQPSDAARAPGDEVHAAVPPRRGGGRCRGPCGGLPRGHLPASVGVAHVRVLGAVLGLQRPDQLLGRRPPVELDDLPGHGRVLQGGGAHHAEQARVAVRPVRRTDDLHDAPLAVRLPEEPLQFAEEAGGRPLEGRRRAVARAVHAGEGHAAQTVAHGLLPRLVEVAEDDQAPGARGRCGPPGAGPVVPARREQDVPVGGGSR
ncbi:hypothetical protein GCM10010145_44590 [Streptomyces ruber]|uniref:Uncharacterized protein n=1 Tax=Streptomyces ruber TaxID=83378 RepID=A0A918BKA9_9ACTN|nr:hypothetical protein GCM10010145_44590 [Streptomyces ruber]